MWKDAWFVGFTADLLAGVWIGRDNSKAIGIRATGGTAALPIWIQFMQASHPDVPPHDFAVPDDVTLVRVDDRTGAPAPPGSSSARWVPFLRGTVPARFSAQVKTTRFRGSQEFAPEETEPAGTGNRAGTGKAPSTTTSEDTAEEATPEEPGAMAPVPAPLEP